MKREELLGWLDSLIINSAELGESADAKSWRDTEGILISRNEAEEIRTHLSLPPAEGATDRFRDVLNEVQRYIETNGGATESEMKAIWNSLSCAITESEKRQPTAEGAEAILTNLETYYDFKFHWIERDRMIRAMHEFATLHAQKIADKMVSDRDDDVFDKMNCLIGYLERWWKNPQSYPPVELKSVIDEAIEYLKSREK